MKNHHLKIQSNQQIEVGLLDASTSINGNKINEKMTGKNNIFLSNISKSRFITNNIIVALLLRNL